jgi:hypothetical protein
MISPSRSLGFFFVAYLWSLICVFGQTTEEPEAHPLEVLNGEGSGDFPEGAEVSIKHQTDHSGGICFCALV